MIASLYQSESDIVWDFRRDAASDAMGSCMCHLARLRGRTSRMFHTSDREVTHHGDPDRHIVRPGKGARLQNWAAKAAKG